MTSPTLEHAMAWLRDGALSPLQAQPGASDDAFDKLSLIFARVFSGPEGDLVLKVLLDVTLFRTPVDHRLEGEAYTRFAQLRAGQNQTMATIVAYLDRARTLRENDHVRRSSGGSGTAIDEPGRSGGGGGGFGTGFGGGVGNGGGGGGGIGDRGFESGVGNGGGGGGGIGDRGFDDERSGDWGTAVR